MTPRLLEIPREIRDLIYEYALVRDILFIERAAATVPESVARRSPQFYRELTQSYPLTRTRAHRRVWSIPRFDLGLPCFKDDPEPPPSDVQMTYQLANRGNLSPQDRIEISLLQTCQQVYHEAREIFYGKNVFGFRTVESVPTAFAFLCDRPAESLKLVSTINITLREGSNLTGTDEAHYPVVARSTDSVVLQYAYNHFTDLCTLLSTSRVALRKLIVVIDSLHQFYRPVSPSPIDCVKWEAQKMTGPRPWVASWVYPLLKLENLECLEIDWIFDRPEICRMADTLSLMRQQMLAPPGTQRQGSSDYLCRPKFDFRISYQITTQERKTIFCRLTKKDFFLGDDGDEDALANQGKLPSSEARRRTAWRRQMRQIFQASGCL